MPNLIDRVVRGLERRTAPNPVYPYPASNSFRMWRPSATGANVTQDTAMELVPVYGAVSMLAGAIGSLPLKVYRDTEPRQEARTSRQWGLLHDQPNDEMAADEFWEIIMTSLLLWGNAFVYKERTQGVVTGLWPIRPSRVQVGREQHNGSSVRYFQLDQVSDRIYETDILHLRGLSTDGLVGLSPIQQARQQLGNAQAHQEFQGAFLKNGLFPSLVFTHPNKLTKDARERLEEDVANLSSWSEAGHVPVLEEGSALTNLTMPLQDAQFVQMAGLTDHQIAQLFGLVPPHQWGVAGEGGKGSMTYQNSEFGGLEFVKWTLRPWLVRIERSLSRDQGIFPNPGPVLFPEFVVDALLRSDTLSRYQAYQIGIQSGFLSVAEVQGMENLEPDDTALAGMPEPADSPSALPAAQPMPELPAAAGRALEALPGPHTGSYDLLADLRGIFRPEIRVEAPQLPPIYVDVPRQLPPDVVTPVNVTVDMQPVADALQALTAAVEGKDLTVNVAAPEVTVNQPETPVQLTLLDEDAPISLSVDFQRNPNGTIKSATVTED